MNILTDLTGIADWAKWLANVFDLKEILIVFAIFLLIFYPTCFFVVLYLTKRPDKLSKLDKKLGGIISGVPQEQKPAETQKEEKPAETAPAENKDKPAPVETETKTVEKKAPKKEDEKPDPDKGLSVIRLKVGDSYRCVLTDSEYKILTGGMKKAWESMDPFVASIDGNTGILQANKTGRAVIEFNRKEVYAIYVINPLKDWFARKDWDILLNEGMASDACNIKIGEGWTMAEESRSNVATFDSSVITDWLTPVNTIGPRILKITLAWTPEGKLRVFTYEFDGKFNPAPALEMIMNKVRGRLHGNMEFWYHKGVNSKTGEYSVDFVTAVAWKENKTFIIFSTTWRDGMNEDEFLNNMDTILRSSQDLLPDWISLGKLGKSIIRPKDENDEEQEETEKEKPSEDKSGEKDSESQEAEDAGRKESEDEPENNEGSETPSEDELPDPNEGAEEEEEEEEEEEDDEHYQTEEDVLNEFPDIDKDGNEE